APLVLDARARELGFPRDARDPRRFERRLRAPQRFGRRRALRGDALRFDADVRRLDVELEQRFGDALARGRGVLQRVPQRGRGIDRGEYFAARRLDVRFKSLDLAVGRFVRVGFFGQRGGRAIALVVGIGGGGAP